MTSTPSSTPPEADEPVGRGTAEPAGSGPAIQSHDTGKPGLEVGRLPEAPATPAVEEDLGRVELFDTGGLDWQPVSSRLVTARTITLLAWLVPMTVALALGGALLASWLWVAAGILALVIVWGLWLIRRQVSAMSYIELSEDLVVRKGRLFRQVSSVPFGRLQYVDLQSGPLERKLGMATLQIFTASPSTSATIPGLPIETAELMRERLMLRGEAQRAGL